MLSIDSRNGEFGSKAQSADQQLNRACESCRLLKVRCLPSSTSPSSICQRCMKFSRVCIFTAPQKRRQRKRTDTRVAELEREVKAMRSLLKVGLDPVKDCTPDPKEAMGDSNNMEHDDRERRLEEVMGNEYQSSFPVSQSRTLIHGTSSSGSIQQELLSGKKPDVVERNLLSMAKATELFECYVNELVQHYPVVTFPSGTTASDIRNSKPVLFLAVITAASCKSDPVLYQNLFDEIIHIFADRIFLHGEKSLELIQSMIVTAVWYNPLEADCAGCKFYQYIHMAATMALEIGLDSKTGTFRILQFPNDSSKRDEQGTDCSVVSQQTFDVDMSVKCLCPESELLEPCRTLLACYLNCAAVAMRIRRPNILRFSSWMGECVELLQKSPVATATDKRLAAWVKLQYMTDEVGSSFAFDDPSTTVSLAELRVQVTLNGFEKRLEEWKEALDQGMWNAALAIGAHQNSIYLHEFAMDGAHHIPDFNPPRCIQSQSVTPPLSAAKVDAIISCVHSAQDLLDAFLSLDIDSLRGLPMVIYVRMSYSLTVLVKISISASTDRSELGQILDRQSLKLDSYLEQLIPKLAMAEGQSKFRAPGKWLRIVDKINKWYRRHSTLLDPASIEEHTEPPRHQSPNLPLLPKTIFLARSRNEVLSNTDRTKRGSSVNFVSPIRPREQAPLLYTIDSSEAHSFFTRGTENGPAHSPDRSGGAGWLPAHIASGETFNHDEASFLNDPQDPDGWVLDQALFDEMNYEDTQYDWN